jgi:hypothetical protein
MASWCCWPRVRSTLRANLPPAIKKFCGTGCRRKFSPMGYYFEELPPSIFTTKNNLHFSFPLFLFSFLFLLFTAWPSFPPPLPSFSPISRVRRAGGWAADEKGDRFESSSPATRPPRCGVVWVGCGSPDLFRREWRRRRGARSLFCCCAASRVAARDLSFCLQNFRQHTLFFFTLYAIIVIPSSYEHPASLVLYHENGGKQAAIRVYSETYLSVFPVAMT